jgi:hypothetical protein
MTVLAGIVSDGHNAGDIRGADAHTIAHLCSVLINEPVLLATHDERRFGAPRRNISRTHRQHAQQADSLSRGRNFGQELPDPLYRCRRRPNIGTATKAGVTPGLPTGLCRELYSPS